MSNLFHQHRSGKSKCGKRNAKTVWAADALHGATEENRIPEILDERLTFLLEGAGIPTSLHQEYVRDLCSIIHPVLDSYFHDLV